MTSSTLLFLTTSVLFFTPADGYTFDCVKLPRPPLHGRVQYSNGTITARLKCPDRSEDLPLTASGDGGILTCDPETKAVDFVYAKRQTCLPYKEPGGLLMPAFFGFTLPECTPDVVKKVKIIVSDKLKVLVPSKCSKLLPRARCYWKNIRVNCGDNFNTDFNYGDEDSKKLIAIEGDFFLSAYDPKIRVGAYQDELEWIYSNYLSKFTMDGSNVPTVTFRKKSFYRSWKASCAQYRNSTVGTTLATHKVASCRGCPMVHMLDYSGKTCQECDRGYWTPAPFATVCVRCPRKEKWDSLELYVKMCGSVA